MEKRREWNTEKNREKNLFTIHLPARGYLLRISLGFQSFGPDHPDVAIRLSNLAELLRAANRPAEAEPLYRQVLQILAKFGHRTGHEHPHFRTAIDNYAELISAMGLSEDAIAARIRSAIESEPEESA